MADVDGGAPVSLRLHVYYGGTFDPVHNGHLAIAQAGRDELGVPVTLVPAADPPHRPPPGGSAEQRVQLLQLALVDVPGLRLDQRELRRARQWLRPSYTIDTLSELRSELGAHAPIAWLLGADSLASLNRWHRWRELLDLAHLVVAERPGIALDAVADAEVRHYLGERWASAASELESLPAGRIWRLRQPLRAESASQVRQRIAAGQPWRHLLPAAVAERIELDGLYRNDAPAA